MNTKQEEKQSDNITAKINLMQKLSVAILIALLSALIVLPGCTNQQTNNTNVEATDLLEQDASAKSYIKDMLLYYKNYDRAAEERVGQDINKLRQIDGVTADTWQNIVGYWDYSEHDFNKSIDNVPTNLPNDDSLCFMVLGLKLKDNGEMEPELTRRLELALNCANSYPNALIVVTGGPTAANNKEATEADLMGQWLIDHGLDSSRILVENNSMTTIQNCIYTYNALRNEHPSINNVALISSEWHLPRASVIFYTTYKMITKNTGNEYFNILANIGCSTDANAAETHIRKARNIGEITGLPIKENDPTPTEEP